MSRQRSGRAAPRSRGGCVTCKKRHVRCDEGRPRCDHCVRLTLHCEYQQAPARRTTAGRTTDTVPRALLPQSIASQQSQLPLNEPPPEPDLDWLLNTSWAGQPCLFPSPNFWEEGVPEAATPIGSSSHLQSIVPPGDLTLGETAHQKELLCLFQRIVQPPAAILIGGQRRWRRIQRYLVGLSRAWAVVRHALLCVIEALHTDEVSTWPGQSRERCLAQILCWHQLTCSELQQEPHGGTLGAGVATPEASLAAIVLLAWFEVVRDHNGQACHFPQRLAELIIVRDHQWNRYSRHLLSWLHTLDCRATYMGGGSPLLSPNALKVVSNYPTQIVAVIKEDADDDEADPEFAAVPDEDQPRPETSPAACAPHASVQPPTISAGHSKQILLHALLQPALQWYSTTQTYCRRISAQDKHHRQRFTPEAEYQVILAYRELESELWRLWSERPKIMLLATDELTKTVSPDVATRLHEVFSVHLASFWILFVYLHRVCWWNLPHSATVKRALEEVWLHLQGAYGELPAGGDKKRIVHPTLMWPVFLFGLECTQPDRREWAIDQLVALGQAKPALKLGEDEDDETLPPFRISSGATRNATRAAALLKEVVKQQDTSAARVDDRDLSMKIFGCYFCLI